MGCGDEVDVEDGGAGCTPAIKETVCTTAAYASYDETEMKQPRRRLRGSSLLRAVHGRL